MFIAYWIIVSVLAVPFLTVFSVLMLMAPWPIKFFAISPISVLVLWGFGTFGIFVRPHVPM